jgi:predicted HD phosphohydrolase
MYVHHDSYVKSLLFDKKLIELGEWDVEDRAEIEKWNETADYELQRGRAAQAISYLILRILDGHCNSSGKMRAKRLGSALADFEQILISARGLERKFYRDHLNHIIRVALLARAIGRKSPFNLSRKQLDQLVLACLFHDVGYPLSRIGQSFRTAVNAMKNCYNIASEASQTSDAKLELDRKLLASVLSLKESAIEPPLNELDHGLLGASEFMTYLKGGHVNVYKDVIRAIAFHSPSFSMKASEKLLFILILADELQDWGRPINLVVIPKIHDLTLDNNILKGEYNTKGVPNYSILKQIYSKSRNLGRLVSPRSFTFGLIFPAENLQMIDLKTFESNLQALFGHCIHLEKSLFAPQHFKKLYESNSQFERIYYGLSIPREVKTRLSYLLHTNTFTSHSFFESLHVFCNRSLGELLFSSDKVGEVRAFAFNSSRSNSIQLELLDDVSSHKGIIKSIHDPEVHKLELALLAELRFHNICVQKITRFPSEPYPVEMGIEGFPDSKDVNSALNKVKGSKSFASLDCLRPIRDSIFNEGVFLFEKL